MVGKLEGKGSIGVAGEELEGMVSMGAVEKELEGKRSMGVAGEELEGMVSMGAVE
ncbi:hypothetical protein [Paenibacillus sp. FSL R7-0179]|uniref:hypothetical protein n=1 Tax=Paenibacillus sp. FSL R7-0179 TaxID=2921672 RepID=UPI0030F6D865